MSTFIAQRVSLDTMRECTDRGCSCFTKKGYQIQYRNGTVDCMLFVCEDCFEKKYKTRCTMGSFSADAYRRKERDNPYPTVNPLLRNVIRWTRKSVRAARMAAAAAAVLLVTAFCLREQPETHMALKTDIHMELRGREGVDGRIASVAEQFTKVLTHGGNANDQ